jgi:hypothetical protein
MRLVQSLQFIPRRIISLSPLSIRALAGAQLRTNTCCRWNSTGVSTSTDKLPAQIPSSGCVNLSPIRGLLALHGPDAAKFLQGLITKIFPSETEPKGMFTSFLSPQVFLLRKFIRLNSGTSTLRYIHLY